MASSAVVAGQVIGGRYRLERRLGEGPPEDPQGVLWLARDQLAADAPSALRSIGPDEEQARARELWSRLQGVLHPQVPRFGAVIAEADRLWLVRDWQAGRTFQELLEARRERQLVFGPGEVLLLLRQLLPVLAALHSQDLLHGDLSPANLLRRDSDGLPVLLDFGLLRGTSPSGGAGDGAPVGATPGYAPPELARGEPAQPWMDLHALGVVALVLLSGDEPEKLLDPVTLDWRWPAVLESEPALRQQLERLLARDPAQRFASAGQALVAFQQLEMPDSTGPVPRADRTVVLVPPAAPPPSEAAAAAGAAEGGNEASPAAAAVSDPEVALGTVSPAADPLPASPPPPAGLPRYLEKEEAAEGGLWPVLIALVLSAVAGTALGWWWLGRGQAPPPPSREISTESPTSLPPAEVDQRQQLLNRLRAMQVDRGWFLSLIDASLLAQYPERKGRLPSDALEDAPLRRVWNELSEEWLARVEQLPLAIRRRLGSFSGADWDRRQADLVRDGLSSEVLQELVSGSARNLLPGPASQTIPAEPYRQLWYAAAELTLANLQIEPIEVRSQITQVVSADVPASGARLFPIKVPTDHGLVVGVNGTPLLQMSLFAPDGRLLAPRGALRVVNLGTQKASPVQLLVTNEGVAPARISLSLRADPPAPPPPAAEPAPQPPDANGVTTQEEPEVPAGEARPPAPSPMPGTSEPPIPPPPTETPTTEAKPTNP